MRNLPQKLFSDFERNRKNYFLVFLYDKPNTIISDYTKKYFLDCKEDDNVEINMKSLCYENIVKGIILKDQISFFFKI
jgi:hypothetical protein